MSPKLKSTAFSLDQFCSGSRARGSPKRNRVYKGKFELLGAWSPGVPQSRFCPEVLVFG